MLTQAIRDGVGLLTWPSDSFAYAESFDELIGRYRGLRGAQGVRISAESPALVVKPDVARRQMGAELPATPAVGSGGNGGEAGPGAATGTSTAPAPGGTADAGLAPERVPLPRPYYGTVTLDPTRVGRDASRIADEVIAHLAGQVGAQLTVTLEIEASIPNGASEQIVRTVTENSRSLYFKNHGFERE